MRGGGGLGVGAVVVLGFGLWHMVHQWWFWVLLVLIGCGLFVYINESKARHAKNREPEHQPRRISRGGGQRSFSEGSAAPDVPTMVVGDDYVKCLNFMRLESWDEARKALQRIAYSMPGQPPEAKEIFTKLMTDFADQDPLVSGVARIAMPVIRANPGVLQTELYKSIPGVGLEEARYALYFLEQLKLIERRKSGRTYKIFEARPILDAEPVAPRIEG